MRRAPIILTVVVGLGLLMASLWCIGVVREVAVLRGHVEARVGLLVEVHATGAELEAATRPDEIAAAARHVDELARTLASQRDGTDEVVVRAREAARSAAELATIVEHSETPEAADRQAIVRELDLLVPLLRRENAELSAKLGEHWSAINVVAALAVALGGATTALLGYLLLVALPRTQRASERLGRLASSLAAAPSARGISHGFGGPVTVALTNLQLLRERLDQSGIDDESRHLLGDALHALARASGTLQDLRSGSIVDDDHEPRAAVEVIESASASEAVAGPSAALRILLIDDDDMVAVSTKRVLAAHDVHTVGDGARGIELALVGDYDVILCDLMMPGKNGIEVYKALMSARPELAARFVFMSGGANDEESAAFLDAYTGPRLDKPFGTKQLRELVAKFKG
ncbi:MAG: response regulator [Deltaproteobacteria bacterium]|nr:response regulator [Nannocystaceae bacterium]